MLSYIVPEFVPFPLFHGTSTVFVESILDKGLAGRNVVKEWRAIECLDQLMTIADAAFGDSPEWIGERYGLDLMRKQEVTCTNMNFRHGGTYLSPDEGTAVRYAMSNMFGSEILSECIKLQRRLENRMGELDVLRASFPQIFVMATMATSPVVIRVDEVPLSVVQTEQAEDAKTQVAEMLMHEPAIRNFMAQQFNFELLQPCRIDLAQVWLVNPSSDSSVWSQSYVLEPYQRAS